ncbi:MAG TPA: ABC transporter ATP-binding protein [Candidatus Dormibacteraeota bacterium]|nr:ABC transporter ATP-binding protein [Candidatus Dormibacteraeota bacterium]
MLELRDLHSYYGRSHIIQGISLQVGQGEGVGLVGHNGVGKTTTLKSIMGLGPRTQGHVAFDGRELRGLPVHARARRGLGFVPDSEAVFPTMTVEENIRTGAFLKARGDQQVCLDAAYELFPVLAERRNQLAGTLSGGQQKMLALARGLALRPRMILVDEPSEGLMPINVDFIARALRRAVEEGMGVLVVDASFHLLKMVCSRLYVMKRGVITGEYRLDEFATADQLVATYLKGED